jgi:tetratricopeptide (TPR) repeat protein
MRWRVILIWAVGWFAAATPCSLRADDSSPHNQAEYLKIYLKINDADQLERKGDYRGALADFKDCYERLQKIHNTDPSWESALVINRLGDCRAKILYLTEEASKQPASSPAPNIETTEGNGPMQPAGDSSEVTALRQKLSEVQQQLEDTQAKLQNSQLETNNLHTQLDAVNQELGALKSGQSEDERMGRLLSENKALTDKLTAAQKEIATIKPLNPKSSLALARAQLKNTEDKLEASEAANTALQQTTSTLQSQLDQAQADLRAANQRLASAPVSSPEYDKLKQDNEIMRDILTREIQEQAHRDMAKRLAQEEFDRLKITSKVLQEQLDILGSPMTPPNTDQERTLIDSLKMPPAQVNSMPAEGNGFSATTPGETPSTNAAPSTPPAADTGMASGAGASTPSTNAPSADVSSGMNPAATDTNAAPLTSATTNAPGMADTNSPPVTVVTPPASTNVPDTNTASSTMPNPSSPENPAATASTNAMVESTPAPSDTSSPTPPATTAADTNSAAPPATNMASVTPDTNAVSSQPPPPPPTGTTTVQETVIKNGGNQEGNEYSSKPRLPDDMRDTAQQAADLFKMQRYDEAADKYQSIIEKYPDSLYAWSNLGVVRFQQKKLPEALKALQRAVALSPTDAFSYSNLGIVYYQLGQYENAISALERALALDPTNAMSHNYLGCACSQKGWQEVAEKEFTKAIELNDSFADAHFNLALIYATEKPPALEMARRHYKRALELGIQPDPRLEKLLQLDGSQIPQATATR